MDGSTPKAEPLMNKVAAIIQARMTSSRLPGKVMRRIIDRPLLLHMIERVQSATMIDRIVVATTLNKQDDPIVELANRHGISVFRGSENNVLSRYRHAAKKFNVKNIMRLTADCPLIDPELLDELVNFFFTGQYDYASNCLEPTLPDGLDAEVITFEALDRVFSSACLPSHLEHVTLYLRENMEHFKIGIWKYNTDLSEYRLTVDQYEDFDLITRIFNILYHQKPDFRLKDIMRTLRDNPGLLKINSMIGRNEGLQKSKDLDASWTKSTG